MDTPTGNSNPINSSPSHFRLWLVVISVIVVVCTLAVLVIYKGTFNFYGNNNAQPTSTPDYGVFLDKGQLDSWENRYGHVQLEISDESGNEIKEYRIALSLNTAFLKDMGSTGERNSGQRKLIPGNIGDIKKAMFVEIYLNNPYGDLTATTETIIYWE